MASIAFEHHLEPFVYETIKLAGDGRVPSVCMDTMHETARKTGAMAVLLFPSFCVFAKSFRPKGCP